MSMTVAAGTQLAIGPSDRAPIRLKLIVADAIQMPLFGPESLTIDRNPLYFACKRHLCEGMHIEVDCGLEPRREVFTSHRLPVGKFCGGVRRMDP